MTHNIKPDYISIDVNAIGTEKYRDLVAYMIEHGITWAWSTAVPADNIGFVASAPDAYGATVSSITARSQSPRTGRIQYGGSWHHVIHYVLTENPRELIKVSEVSRKIAGDRMAAKQKQMKSEGYEGPFGLPHHCFSFNEAVSFTLNEAGDAVIQFD